MNICTEEMDRISALPDKILCHILALLSTKGAVATSILSKRWQYVWTGVPVLRFTDFFLSTADAPSDKEQFARYKNFVNRVLFLNHASCLERIHFWCNDWFSPSNVYEWMLVIANRCFKVLSLVTRFQSLIKLPSTLLLHKDNLVVLKLWGKLELRLPSSIHLPRLTRLSFTSVQFRDADDPFSILVSGSPTLKLLTANLCQGFNKISVCSSTLSVLKIESIAGEAQSITIKTPKLQRLDLSMSIVQSSISELPSLDTAKLEVRTSAARWAKILKSFCSVKTLVLYRVILDGSNTINHLPIFHNLTQLIVSLSPWSSVLHLLRNAPNLDTLNIDELMIDQLEIMSKNTELALKEITCYSSDIGVGYLQVLRFLLSNSKLLNELKVCIHYGISLKSEFRTLKKLLELPRASATCRILLISGNDSDSEDEDDY